MDQYKVYFELFLFSKKYKKVVKFVSETVYNIKAF